MLWEFHWHDLIRCRPLCFLIVKKCLKRSTWILCSPQVHILNFLMSQWWQNPLLCYNFVNWEMWLKDPSSFLVSWGAWLTDECPATQRDLGRLGRWVSRSLLKLNNGQWQFLPLGRNYPVQLTSWKAFWQKSIWESWWIPSWPCHVPLWQKHPGLHQAVSTAAGGAWSFPSAEPWWDKAEEGPWRQLRAWESWGLSAWRRECSLRRILSMGTNIQ